ncbi:MAG: BrnA antitoxin family protein [Methylovulum sp.]|nr:BrnA antitoxin family protein [Methylovulum sp.]
MNKANNTPLTKQQLAALAHLEAMPDEQIDYSDIAATSEEQWREAKQALFYRPVKQQLALRIDADVVNWFKSQGSGYQARINELLRQAMIKEINQE